MYEYYDFYEPSEYDQMVEEFMDTLRASVKKEWLDRMDRLEAENKELQDVKKNFAAIKNDYEKAKRNCEAEKRIAIENATRDARRARLSELLGDTRSIYWSITTEYVNKPKCDKCDKNRQIEYITPLGRKAKEYCTCYDSELRYIPSQNDIYSIRLHDSTISVRFLDKKDDMFASTVTLKFESIVKDGDDISAISKNKVRELYFESLGKCQEFCDYLNENNIENGERR